MAFNKPQLLKSAISGAKCFSTSTQVKYFTYYFVKFSVVYRQKKTDSYLTLLCVNPLY